MNTANEKENILVNDIIIKKENIVPIIFDKILYHKEKANNNNITITDNKTINTKNKIDILLLVHNQKGKNQHFDTDQSNKENNIEQNIILKEEIIFHCNFIYFIEIQVKFDLSWRSALDQKYDNREKENKQIKENFNLNQKIKEMNVKNKTMSN